MKNSELHKVKKLLRKLLLGITLPTEYITLRRGDLPYMLKTVISTKKDGKENDTSILFLGYKISLVGIVSDAESEDTAHRIINFAVIEPATRNVYGGFTGRSGPDIILGSKRLNIVQASYAQQWIESEVHQTNAKFFDLFRKKREGNIDQRKPEYDFLKMQYSVPREIRLVVVSHGDKFNVFPIDLFGFVGDDYMILSLRHRTKSCTQVETTGKIATWIVNASIAKHVYEMGRNHGRDFQSIDELPLTHAKSPVLGWPMPEGGIQVEEFELVRKVEPDYGHHRLFILKRVGNKAEPSENSLVHIHRAFAEWLLKQGIPVKQISR